MVVMSDVIISNPISEAGFACSVKRYSHDKDMTSLTTIKYLVVHCSDSPDDAVLSARDIHEMHLGFGWDGAGYHRIITKDGTVHAGRPDYWQGAHVKGQNHQSLGVCLTGRIDFTPAQMASLEALLLQWLSEHPDAEIVGHRDIQDTSKTCPNFDVASWWSETSPLSASSVRIISPSAGLYSIPPSEQGGAERVSEALYGEAAIVTDTLHQNGYVQIKTEQDSYHGWVALSYIAASDKRWQSTHQVTVPLATVTTEPDVKSGYLCALPLGSRIDVTDDSGEFAKLALYGRQGNSGTGYISKHAIKRSGEHYSDWVSLAEQFIATPYLWGGKSYKGLDCSGLIQLCLNAAGYAVPRDSGPQYRAMHDAQIKDKRAFTQFNRSDLLFWEGHVGVMLNERQLLHANAFHHCVASEPVQQAIARISQSTGQPVAHIDGQQLLDVLPPVKS